MRAFIKVGLALTLALALGGCETMDSLNPFSDSPSEARTPVSDEPIGKRDDIPKEPVTRITKLELGKLFRGYMLNAEGVAPAIGYYAPELRPRRNGRLGADGFVEFDFLAAPPKERIGANAPEKARTLEAFYELTPSLMRRARGVRVYAAEASVEGRF